MSRKEGNPALMHYSKGISLGVAIRQRGPAFLRESNGEIMDLWTLPTDEERQKWDLSAGRRNSAADALESAGQALFPSFGTLSPIFPSIPSPSPLSLQML